ncbi:solute carrier family 22 member 8-like, partial [Stylophora pistillata]|uniref:solute carrier family 22 member 8-like n=1 Tax=Stylophora pistillata TaxID=50429 RepID=UPI000C04C852
MAMTADEVLEKIGSFGRFQLFSLVLSSVNQCFWYAWPVLLMTFITAEPAWRCVSSNSTECPFGGTMKPGDLNYNFRCNISRTSWEFVEDFTSIVTQFYLVCNNAIYGTISSSLIFAGWSLGAIMIGPLGDKFGRKKAVY